MPRTPQAIAGDRTRSRSFDLLQRFIVAEGIKETAWIAQLDLGDSIAALEAAWPDYRGLHVSLYDLPSKQFIPPKH